MFYLKYIHVKYFKKSFSKSDQNLQNENKLIVHTDKNFICKTYCKLIN